MLLKHMINESVCLCALICTRIALLFITSYLNKISLSLSLKASVFWSLKVLSF